MLSITVLNDNFIHIFNHFQERVRIVDGPTQFAGIAEVNENGTWKRFCQHYFFSWAKGSVEVFCRQLGYSAGLKSVSWPANDTIPKIRCIYICNGDERHILECWCEELDEGNCPKYSSVVCQEHVTGKFTFFLRCICTYITLCKQF